MLEVHIPENYKMLQGIPVEDYPVDMAHFWQTVACELREMIVMAAGAAIPSIVMSKWILRGSQYTWEFYVNDLAKPARNETNFHGQNTSRWVYAGAIVLQNNRVSAHH